jgi:hypothetical protein
MEVIAPDPPPIPIPPDIVHPTWQSGVSYGVAATVERSGEIYNCIQAHTSSAANAPGTGADWQLYWEETGNWGWAEPPLYGSTQYRWGSPRPTQIFVKPQVIL